MADQEEEDLKMALRMSMQHEPPEPKRSRPGENKAAAREEMESPELRNRRMQRELMASAAEKRITASRNASVISVAAPKVEKSIKERKDIDMGSEGIADCKGENIMGMFGKSGVELSMAEAHQLFSMIFGVEVTKAILAQWSNQGIR